MDNPFVIAEAASTHEGRRDWMFDLIDAAKGAGANAFKTAWGRSGLRIAERMHAPEHADMYQRLFAWPGIWLPEIAQRCRDAGVEFLCTVDCPEDIEVVAPYVDRFKIASWGATDAAFIRAHRRFRKPLIISTGLGAGPPLRESGDWVLHCTSAYPTPLDEANLAVLRRGAYDGLSDHTARWTTGGLAVAAGAKVLEVHVRHHETPANNPDYEVSLTPERLTDYIEFAREAATACGDGVKRLMPSEAPNVRYRYV